MGFINAETLDIGGDRVQIVNGTITEKDTKIVLPNAIVYIKEVSIFKLLLL